MKYDPTKIEPKWQKEWEKSQIYRASDGPKNKYYLLVEFPYPSGNLHVGHWYAFSVPDMLARYMRMRGREVLFPIGFDAFGLPAENAAIQRGLNPREWTRGNMDHMRTQLRSMGSSFDWSREVVTCDPDYYKWTQWQFLQFFKEGLAYLGEREVNWCPKDKTVLANEQVVDGKCERCGTEVEKRNMLQWNLRITDYADRLIDDLEPLNWPEQIKESQRNWIGRSEGAEIDFAIAGSIEKITVFTTRPDTLYGSTYAVLAPEHPLIETLSQKIENLPEARAYAKAAAKKSEMERTAEGKEKTGIELKGVRAINPATKKEIPVFIADYVLGHYGTGAIMAVPAHDERDFEFATKFDLPITEVISGGDALPYTGSGRLSNSGEFSGASSEETKNKITEKFGRPKKTYKLRDWVVSRQRYWGVPIPIIHCARCGVLPVPEKDLPVLLPEIDDYLPRDDGKSPLAKAREWVEVKCPQCEGAAERETDTFDTFVDSSWYFNRYTDPHDGNELASKEKLELWMPVDLYSGGAEHTTMHVLYSRFWHKALFDLGLVSENEPYIRRMNRGLVMGPDGQKMSKRFGNVIDPDEEVKRFGADTVRMYLAFIGPYNEVGAYPWDPNGTLGMRRFLERVWRVTEKADGGALSAPTETLLEETKRGVAEDIERLKFNTAISKLMVLLNALEKEERIPRETLRVYLVMLAPFAPHITEELFHVALGETDSVHEERWPEFDEMKLRNKTVTVVIQINGKVRGSIELPVGADKSRLEREARGAIEGKLEGKTIVRTIVVPDRLVNFVVTEWQGDI